MGIFDRFIRKKSTETDDIPASMPWDERPSIYEHICSHLDLEKPGLTEGGFTLPDEERINEGSQIRWAAGAMDGVATHHMSGNEADEIVQKTVELVLVYCHQPTVANKEAIYQSIRDENAVSMIDPVIEALVSAEGINNERLYELAYSLTTESPDREPVKFGIAILGLFDPAANQELFQTLGRHDEFTLFCAVSLSNVNDDSDEALWTLARTVDGWRYVSTRLRQFPFEISEYLGAGPQTPGIF